MKDSLKIITQKYSYYIWNCHMRKALFKEGSSFTTVTELSLLSHTMFIPLPPAGMSNASRWDIDPNNPDQNPELNLQT